MAEGPAEKKDGFERWVASLKHEARTLNVPGARVESDHDSVEPPPGGPLTFDEQVTLVQRLPKEIIKALREREARATRESSRPLGKVDEESTAVFVPPPELLARAKRFEPPPKPGAASRPATAPPAASPPSSRRQAGARAESRPENELPTMPPPPLPFDELPEPRGESDYPGASSFPGPSAERPSVPGALPERRSGTSVLPAGMTERRSAPAPNNIKTPTFAFQAAVPTPAGGFPAASAPTPVGSFPAFTRTVPGGFPAATHPAAATRTPAGAFSAATPPGPLPAPAPLPGSAAARSGVTRPTLPGVPSSVPRAFTAALVRPKAELQPAPAAQPPQQLDAVETEEPTSRGRFARPDLVGDSVLPAPILNLNPPDVDPETEPETMIARTAPHVVIESVAPPTGEVDSGWDDQEAETRTMEPLSAREPGSSRQPASSREPASGSDEAAEEAPSGGSRYLLWIGWSAAALLVAGAAWLTFFK